MLDYKHIFTRQTICKLVKSSSSFQYYTQKITWPADSQLDCYFENVYVDEQTHFCIEVSINGGHTFSSACTTTVFAHRIPFVTHDSFTPTNSHVQDVVTLEISGSFFDPADSFRCVFGLETPAPFNLEPIEIKTTDVTVVSDKLVICKTPVAQFEETHKLRVTLVHSSGLTIYRFSKPFVYFSYLWIDSVTPTFGTSAGNTLLDIRVHNMPLPGLYETPMKCRFNFNFDTTDLTFETDA